MKRILLALAILITSLLVLGQFLSSQYEAVAEREIKGTSAQIHELVGNLETWEKWGPWMKTDPNMKIERGPTTGVGAKQSWQGKDGSGHLVFTEVDPAKGIKYDLFFDAYPKCEVEFRYAPAGEKTKVTWVMRGEVPTPLVGGYLAWLFKNMITKSFYIGLENIDKMINE